MLASMAVRQMLSAIERQWMASFSLGYTAANNHALQIFTARTPLEHLQKFRRRAEEQTAQCVGRRIGLRSQCKPHAHAGSGWTGRVSECLMRPSSVAMGRTVHPDQDFLSLLDEVSLLKALLARLSFSPLNGHTVTFHARGGGCC